MKFIVPFLTEMFELGCSFNAINLAKSALFSIVPVDGKIIGMKTQISADSVRRF